MYRTIQQPKDAKESFPSDILRLFYELCKNHSTIAELFEMRPQICFVIDTNVVLDELLFVTTKRKKDSARTALREVLDSGLLVTIAPTKLHEEINRHIPRLAQERSVPERRFWEAWLELQARIEFRDVKESVLLDHSVRDPDDVPFITLYWTSGADAVLTRDKDISAMGAKSLGPEVLLPVRDYARAKSPEVSLRLGGILVVGIPIASLVMLFKLLSVALRAFRDLSPAIQLILLAGAIVAALHPKTRKALSDCFSSVTAGFNTSARVFGEVFGELSIRIAAAQSEVKSKQSLVESFVPTRSPVSPTFASAFSVHNKRSGTVLVDANLPVQSKPIRPKAPKRRRSQRSSVSKKFLVTTKVIA